MVGAVEIVILMTVVAILAISAVWYLLVRTGKSQGR